MEDEIEQEREFK